MARFKIHSTTIKDLEIIERSPVEDVRGFLTRVFCANELAVVGWDRCVAQINHTGTHKKGTVRGMHCQYPPHAELKLVSCLRGHIWDVAVDFIQKAHVVSTPGTAFGAAGEGYLRMSYANSEDNLIEELRRIKEVVTKHSAAKL